MLLKYEIQTLTALLNDCIVLLHSVTYGLIWVAQSHIQNTPLNAVDGVKPIGQTHGRKVTLTFSMDSSTSLQGSSDANNVSSSDGLGEIIWKVILVHLFRICVIFPVSRLLLAESRCP